MALNLQHRGGHPGIAIVTEDVMWLLDACLSQIALINSARPRP
jgi:hypothetical protein